MRIRHIRKAQFAKTRTPASVAFALLGVAALGLASCSVSNQSGNRNLSTTTTQQTSDEARQTGLTTDARQTRTNRTTIALLVPLSRQGQTAEIAKGLKQAGELALFEYKDPNLQLVVKDTAGTPEGAKAAATAALDAGAQIIIGPLFAASVTSVAAVAKPRGVPIIAFSNDETVAGANTYLLSFQPRQEISRIVSYASAMGKRRFAGLIADDTYGKVLKREFQSAVAATGGRMIALETYPRGANGMLERSQKLFERISDQPADGEGNAAAQTAPTASRSVDAVFVPGDAEILPTLGPIMTYAKIDASRTLILGSGGWDYRGVNRVTAFRGGVFAAPDPRGFQQFSAKYANTFGASPPRIASFAYDGVAIAATLATRHPTAPFSVDKITAPAGFAGIDGPVRFMRSGLTERGLAIVSVTEFGTRVVEPAPTAFQPQAARTAGVPSQRFASGASQGSTTSGLFQQ